MKTAAAYVSDIILGRTGDVIGRESQKELIKQYAAENGIDIVAWFEDDLYNEDVLSRPGVQELLANRDQYQLVLVERVWALSRLWSVCERFFEELERADLRLESATTMWDCVSQMARRRFDKTLKTPKLRPARDVVTRRDAEPVRIKRPARLHFVFEQPAAARKEDAMRTAIAYVTDTLICPSKGASPAAEQEACIRAYAAANGIEIVKVVRDELCTPHPLGRPGMMDVMLAGPEVATVLVDTVQAVAPRWSDIQTVIRELKRRGLRLECATMRFDLASQMARRAFDPERFVPDVVRRLREVKHARPKVRVVKPNGYPTLSPRPHAV